MLHHKNLLQVVSQYGPKGMQSSIDVIVLLDLYLISPLSLKIRYITVLQFCNEIIEYIILRRKK